MRSSSPNASSFVPNPAGYAANFLPLILLFHIRRGRPVVARIDNAEWRAKREGGGKAVGVKEHAMIDQSIGFHWLFL